MKDIAVRGDDLLSEILKGFQVQRAGNDPTLYLLCIIGGNRHSASAGTGYSLEMYGMDRPANSEIYMRAESKTVLPLIFLNICKWGWDCKSFVTESVIIT